MEQRWISVKERLPEVCGRVIVGNRKRRWVDTHTFYPHLTNHWWPLKAGVVTHWMPLPGLPPAVDDE